MNRKLPIFLVVLLFSLTACKVTGPADDEYETKKSNANTGRIFSKDGSALTIFSSDEKDKGALFNSNKDAKGQATSGSSSPASDYENYKQWNEAKQADSAEYEKFKKWQEFEEYNRWKEQQKSK